MAQACVTDRPRCRCHDEPMDATGHGFECSVTRRARQLAAYHADPATDNYARTRRALRARITEKRRRVADLEGRLEEEDPR